MPDATFELKVVEVRLLADAFERPPFWASALFATICGVSLAHLPAHSRRCESKQPAILNSKKERSARCTHGIGGRATQRRLLYAAEPRQPKRSSQVNFRSPDDRIGMSL